MTKFIANLVKVHNEEDGMEALQTVAIMAFAAIVLAFLWKIFNGGGDGGQHDTDTTIGEWVVDMVNKVLSWK